MDAFGQETGSIRQISPADQHPFPDMHILCRDPSEIRSLIGKAARHAYPAKEGSRIVKHSQNNTQKLIKKNKRTRLIPIREASAMML
jgi:hypothetical protein